MNVHGILSSQVPYDGYYYKCVLTTQDCVTAIFGYYVVEIVIAHERERESGKRKREKGKAKQTYRDGILPGNFVR